MTRAYSGDEESFIRRVLWNDTSKIVMVIGVVMGFVSTVVIPIQKMQLQIATLQNQIAEQLNDYEEISKDHATFKSEMKNTIEQQEKIDARLQLHLQTGK